MGSRHACQVRHLATSEIFRSIGCLHILNNGISCELSDIMNKKVLAVAMATVFLMSVALGVVPYLDDSEADSRTLVVETSPDFAPYDYYYGTQFAGIDMDILRAIAKDTGYNIEFRQNNFDSILLSVEAGKCDFGASGFTISDERKQSVDFTEPYSKIKQVVVTQIGNSSITSEKDLQGKKVAAQTGTSGYDYAETIEDAVLVPQKGYPEIVLDLLNKKVDCEIVDDAVAMAQVAAHPKELKILDILDVEPEYYGFAFKKGSPIYSVINESLKRLQADGTVDMILDYYADHGYSSDTPPYPFDKKTLVVETSPDFAPYEYLYGTEYAGIDMDLVRAVGKDLGYNIVFKQNNFDSIILSVAQGKSDFGASGFTYSESRAESVNFSSFYSEIKQVVVAKAGLDLKSEDDVRDKRISVQTGTSGADYAEELSSNVVYQKTYNEVVLDLLNDKSFCEVVDMPVAQAQVSAHPELQVYNILDIDIEHYGFIFSKENTELLNEINGSLERLKKNGTIDSIIQYYADNSYRPDTPSYYNQDKTLFVLTSDDAPYAYSQNGNRYAGMDVDIVKAVGEKMGYKVRFIQTPLNEIIGKVQGNGTYIGVSGLAINDADAELVDFTGSISYGADNDPVIIAPKGGSGFKDLSGMTMAIVSGSPFSEYLLSKGASVEGYENLILACAAVGEGTVDGLMVDGLTAKSLLFEHDSFAIYDDLTDAVAPVYGYVFNKDSAELRKAFEDAYSDLKADGTISSITSYYEQNDYNPSTSSIYDESDDLSFFENLWNKFKKDFLENDRYQYIFTGLGNTLKIAVLALIIGLVIGILVAAVMSMHAMTGKLRIPHALCRVYVTVVRGTPVMVQLLLIYYVVFASVNLNQILIASVAFGINSGAYVAEIVRSGINAVPKGQMEAARCLGLNTRQSMTNVIVPQAIRNIMPALGNEGISLIKETSIAGFIGVMDLTRAADIIRGQTYDALLPLLVVAIIYLAIVLVLQYLVGRMEKRLNNAY